MCINPISWAVVMGHHCQFCWKCISLLNNYRSYIFTFLCLLLSTHDYRQGVGISFTVCFVCVCVFVRLRISPTRIKLAASNFARQFIGVQGRESQAGNHTFLWTLLPTEGQNGTNWPARQCLHDFTTITLWLPSTWQRAACRRVWLYGGQDGPTCFLSLLQFVFRCCHGNVMSACCFGIYAKFYCHLQNRRLCRSYGN